MHPEMAAPGSLAVVDSSAAAATAWSAGEGSFVAQHPGGMSALAVSPAYVGAGGGVVYNTGPSVWSLSYQACAPAANGSIVDPLPVPTYNATVDATTGKLRNESESMQPCAFANVFGTRPTSLAAALTLGTPVLTQGAAGALPPPCLAGDYCYTIPILSAAADLSPDQIRLQVENGAGPYALAGTGGASLVDASGNVVVSHGLPPGSDFVIAGWGEGTAPADAPLTPSMSFVLDLSTAAPSGHGLVLTISGYGGFTGQLSEPLP